MATPSKSVVSLEQGIRTLALKKLSKTTKEQFLAEFKNQGINSLDDLVVQTLKTAGAASKAGIWDEEDRGICYKFTMWRPHFDPGNLKEVLAGIDQKLIQH
jgi:hypothetical protein